MLRWRLLSTTVVSIVASASLGAAASLAFSGGSLGFAGVSTPRCTSAALSVTPVLTASTISSVTVAGLPAACGGAALSVTADNGVSSSSGSTTVPGGGGAVSVSLTGTASLIASVRIDLVLVGP